MNLAKTVEINKQIIKLIYEKTEEGNLYSVPYPERTYVERLIADNANAEKWLAQGSAK